MSKEEWEYSMQVDAEYFSELDVTELVETFQRWGEFLVLYANTLLNHLDDDGRKESAEVVRSNKERSDWEWNVLDFAVAITMVEDEVLNKMREALGYFDLEDADKTDINSFFGLE